MIDVNTRMQFLRYALVGITFNLLLYLAYLGLTLIGLGHKVAMTLLYVSGTLCTFTANSNWSFKHQGFAHVAFVRYLIVYAFGYLLNLGLLWFAVDQLDFPHQIVQATAVVVVAISLFILHKYWVFAANSVANSKATL